MTVVYVGSPGGSTRDLSELYRREIEQHATLRVVELSTTSTEYERASIMREADILLICRHSLSVPVDIAAKPGGLRYLCADIGSLKLYIPDELPDSGVLISNWGDAPALEIAEGAMCLLLAVLKDLHTQLVVVREGGWKLDRSRYGGSLSGMHLGVYGAGEIGRTFLEMVKPFGPTVHVYDPYVSDLPGWCIREHDLRSLFGSVQAVVIHAGLTVQTSGSVTAEFLALLPDNAVIINTARGAIIDQSALFHELKSGRLRAGLDVLDPDELATDHPARTWPNVILSAHQIYRGWPEGATLPLSRARRIAVANIRAFSRGELPHWLIDRDRWNRMT